MDSDRTWMYKIKYPGRAGTIPEFLDSVTRFINHAKTLDDFSTSRLIRCPCVNCENVRYHQLRLMLCILCGLDSNQGIKFGLVMVRLKMTLC